jgi:hypothetical protein
MTATVTRINMATQCCCTALCNIVEYFVMVIGETVCPSVVRSMNPNDLCHLKPAGPLFCGHDAPRSGTLPRRWSRGLTILSRLAC